MPDTELTTLRTQLVAARAELVAAAKALPLLRDSLVKAEASLKTAQQKAATLSAQLEQLRATNPLSPQIPLLQQQLTSALASVGRAQTTVNKARAALEAGIKREADARLALAALEARYHAREDALLATLAPTLPVLLLPVRLETRFVPRTGSTGTDLLVRIYPDDVAEDAHQPALTVEEVDAARTFVERAGIASPAPPPVDKVERAWVQLAQQVGPARAAWIVRRIAEQVASGRNPVPPGGSPAAWARAPLARGLPDSWLVMAYRRSVDANGREHLVRQSLTRRPVARGAPILSPLSTGPAPDRPRVTLPDSGLEIDESMRWMVDVEEAVRVGMGVRIELTTDQALNGFDLLMVLGVRVSLDESESAAELTTLFDAHHYTWGLGLVPQGTPTNNTGEGAAGYASRDADLVARYHLEHDDIPSAPDAAFRDGNLLATALGIRADVLSHVAHAQRYQHHSAGQMLDVLWPATWAYFVGEMLHPIFTHLQDYQFDLARCRAFAVRNVRARGPLPALRVGSQPYGVLPVTSLDRWHSASPALPELIFFRIRNPPGENVGEYGIYWDVDATGHPAESTDPITVPGWFGAEDQGGAIAAIDLDGSGRADLLVAHVDNPGGENVGYYRVGRNLEPRDPATRGTASSWTAPVPIPGWFGAETRAMGIATARVPGRTLPALVVHHVDHPDVRIASAPEAVRLSSTGQILVFARGADGAFYQKTHDGKEWRNWERVDVDATASNLAAVATLEPFAERLDRVDLFCRREPDGAIWHRSVSRGQWTRWASLRQRVTLGPGVCSWAPGRLDLFAAGIDGTLVHAWMERGVWSAWESLGGGVITSDPAAVSWGSGRIDIFARGTDNALYHKWYEGAWSVWEPLGGTLASGPAVCSWGAGRLDVFAVWTDGALHHRWFERTWSDWTSIGGAPPGDLSAVAVARGRIDLFARDAQGRLLRLTNVGTRLPQWETITDRERAYYRIGLDLDAAGNVAGPWTEPTPVPGFFGGQVVGGGVAVGDVSGNGTPDLLLFHLEQNEAGVTTGTYRIGWDLSSGGQVAQWSAPLTVPWTLLGPPGGADVTLADLTGNGRPDLIVHYVEQRGSDWFAAFRIGYDLAVNGVPARWSDTLNAAPGAVGPVAGVGVTVANVGRATGTFPVSATGSVNLLSALRDPWHRSLPKVPRVGASTLGEPANKRLVEMLGMEPLSGAFAARSVHGRQFMARLWTLLARPIGSLWLTAHDTLAARGFRALGLAGGGGDGVRLRDAAFAAAAAELHGPLVETGDLSETDGLRSNYIASLMRAHPEEIFRHALPQEQRGSLLYLLLRQALLWEYAEAAYVVKPPEMDQPPRDPSLPRDPELVDIGEDNTPTPWRRLTKRMNAANARPLVSDHLHMLVAQGSADPVVAGLLRIRTALERLAALPTAELERLLCETLDLSTHRLDAWITSVAAERLRWVREASVTPPAGVPIGKPTGIALGGYGWVEDLRPEPVRTSGGYVHAPSLAHATTAAILRSGYLAHTSGSGGAGDGVLAVNLSSGRVRTAVSLLEGVREGQSLGALLGYRFERGLHENYATSLTLDNYIRPFRELAPLAARKLTPGPEPAEAVAAANVVDGLALVRRWQDGKRRRVWTRETIPFGGTVAENMTPALPPVVTPTSGTTLTTDQKRYLAIERELNALEDTVDAVSDAVVAESVHQVVQGSPLRAGASLDAVSRGEAPLPELEVARTPRTGIALTHRLVTLFEGNAPTALGGDPFVGAWYPGDPTDSGDTDAMATAALQVRAAAEPQLNGWAARLLGDPARVRCRVEYTDPATDALTKSEVTLKDLLLSPLDLVYAAAEVEAAPRTGPGQGSVYFPARSEIEERVRLHAMAMLSGGAPVRVIYDRDSSWTSANVSFPELLEVARRVRDLFTAARALDERDLVQPRNVLAAAVLDDTDLRNRADAAVNALDAAVQALKQLTQASAPAPDALRDALLALSYFGAQGALPQAVSGTTAERRAALLEQATRLVADLEPRVAALRAAEAAFSRATQSGETAVQAMVRQRAHDVERLHGVFGNEFRVLQRFRPFDAATLAGSLNASTALLGNDPLAAVTWLQRAARVRAGAARLETTLLCVEAIGGGDLLRPRVAQLPRDAGELWVGLGGRVKGGRLSIVAHTPGHDGSFDATSWLSGLLGDEWVEVVPNEEETTAVTFHYNAPGAVAPQSLLLAVPPDVRRPWSVDTLEAILLETLDLAKLRLVDLDALAEVGHYFPGLYFAFNAAGDTISADFAATASSPPSP